MIGSLAELGGYIAPELGKVYCTCGRIVDLDRSTINLKRQLGKPIECNSCRNRRISCEIDLLDRHFLGEEEEDDYF